MKGVNDRTLIDGEDGRRGGFSNLAGDPVRPQSKGKSETTVGRACRKK